YGGTFYRQHPVLRAYAHALLARSREHNQVMLRYVDHILPITEEFSRLPPDEWGKLTPYLPHVHTVGDALARWLGQPNPPEPVLGRGRLFASNIIQYLALRRQLRKPEWLEMGLAASRALGEQAEQVRFLNELGALYSDLGEVRRALDYFEQALPLRKAVG